MNPSSGCGNVPSSTNFPIIVPCLIITDGAGSGPDDDRNKSGYAAKTVARMTGSAANHVNDTPLERVCSAIAIDR
jgi:hypothetical protein